MIPKPVITILGYITGVILGLIVLVTSVIGIIVLNVISDPCFEFTSSIAIDNKLYIIDRRQKESCILENNNNLI